MEHHDHQVSKSSSTDEEADQRSDANDGVGTGRSYECVFCKRGFTTAQALGGHMNIHRRERAPKTRPSSAPNLSSSISKSVDDHNHPGLRSYREIQSYPPHYSTAPDHDQVVVDHHVNYRTFMPAPTGSWVVRPSPHANYVSEEDLCARNYIPRHRNLLTDDHRDWRSGSSLSLGIGRPSHDLDNNKDRVANGAGSDEELDLELRLGHDPLYNIKD
ncbi:unnamed protein product [Prunus armeniaca]|uniref:C2H2-type domain-containing protein n=2 Tax=Prunus TaxID=3754 RepID=A0A6J5YBQ0_PRUAR|nr:PREDICTED: probable transcriptional regulator RABBIT EARS [Prunus mume]KAH0978284.1 hypothetical protein GBA52_028003 [Prunus armeniaca]CAB4291553.1 unnamed protein product [Prunus armeniaca]CAB4321867.1 unnamed protein product [Prunus armeniaca]